MWIPTTGPKRPISYLFRCMQDLVMGIVVGTVFWQVQVSYIL